MTSSILKFFLDQPLKHWLTRKKRGEDENTKIGISRERKELFHVEIERNRLLPILRRFLTDLLTTLHSNQLFPILLRKAVWFPVLRCLYAHMLYEKRKC